MNRWLVSARFDLAAFVLPAALGVALGALQGALAPGGATPPWAFLALVVLVDVAHVHGTTLRVYLDPEELRRRGLYLAAPVACFAAGVALYSVSALVFWRAAAYLAVIHFVRQQVGWLRLYRRRAGDTSRPDRLLDEAAIYAATLYPLVVWHAKLPLPFSWFVDGDFLAGLPAAAARAALFPYLAILGAFALRQAQRVLRGERLQTGKVLLVASTAATWGLGIVVWRTDFAFTATNVLAHGVPYMAISFRVGVDRWEGARGALRLVFRRGRFALYALALAALAYAEEWLWDATVWRDHAGLFPAPALELTALHAVLVPLLAVPQLTHYTLDAFLWRMDGSNPGLARALGVEAAASVAAPAPAPATA
ncbi:MAG TPA: hypothetical protein VND93_32835 [Myxococcales bacterium]|nr:hypothetical protein [Myxococcales bacterium]